jgi:hypothetical protein
MKSEMEIKVLPPSALIVRIVDERRPPSMRGFTVGKRRRSDWRLSLAIILIFSAMAIIAGMQIT